MGGIRVEDFEFITKEEAMLTPNVVERINKLLNEKAQRGYAEKAVDGNVCHTIGPELMDSDDNEAFVFLREIKEEQPEPVTKCDHKQYNGKPYYLTWDGKCPNCGKAP